jgi:uncharacterized protein
VLREELNNALKLAMKSQDKSSVGTIRLVLASIKDQDIAARGDGNLDGISDAQVLVLLQTMVKQRNESARLYEDGGRHDLAEQEKEEIQIIRRFTPRQLEVLEVESVVREIIKEIDMQDLKDMGKIMGLLKERYPGQIDPSKASSIVRGILTG